YEDACGNQSTPFVQTITWTQDTQAPTVTGQAAITATGCTAAPAFIDPTPADNCGTPTLVAGYPQTSVASTVNCTSTQTRTWVYEDACGNQSTPFVQTITWTQDTQAPTVTGQATITATGCTAAPAFVDPTPADNCGTPTLVAGYPQTSVASTVNCTSTQTRTWVYEDACGNQSTPFVQTITWTQDTQAPTVTGQAAITATGCTAAPAFIDPTPADNCGTPTLVAGYPQTSVASTVNCTSTQTRTWVYEDACGNQSTPFVQTITWTLDTQAPTVTGQAAITDTGCTAAPAFIDPTPADNCGTPTLVAGYPQTSVASTVNCTSTQTRTWVYQDACGNQSTPFVQTITWTQDTQAPTVTGQATITATGCTAAPAFIDPTPADNCGTPTLVAGYPQTSVASTVNCTSTQTRTWVYEDACGNQSTPFVQTITWTQDTQAPTVTGQAAITATGCTADPKSVDHGTADNLGA